MTKCKNCYDPDPVKCEAKAMSIPEELVAGYEQCGCECHNEDDSIFCGAV